MERGLFFRRTQKTNRLKRTKRIAKEFFPPNKEGEQDELIDDWSKKNTDNLKCCSCSGCGNPRKHQKGKDKLTIQEKRSLESEEDFEQEY